MLVDPSGESDNQPLAKIAVRNSRRARRWRAEGRAGKDQQHENDERREAPDADAIAIGSGPDINPDAEGEERRFEGQ